MDSFVIKGTILGISESTWSNDMSMFVSTLIMVMENWADETFILGSTFRHNPTEIAKKRLGEAHEALHALSNDIHILSICYHQFKHTEAAVDINNRLKALYFTNLAESYFTNIRSIYDRIAHFPRILLGDDKLDKRAVSPDSLNSLIKFCNRPDASLFFPNDVLQVILEMEGDLQIVRTVRDSIIHNGKETIVDFDKDTGILLNIPKKSGQYQSLNLLPDILHLGATSYPLYEYLRNITVRLFRNMEELGAVLFFHYKDLKPDRQFYLFGLTGYCMKDFVSFLSSGGKKEYLYK